MNEDELCEEIKERLLVLGVSKNKTFNDISYLTLDDIHSMYMSTSRKGHNFYLQNKDLHIEAKKSYEFFKDLFEEHNARTLGDIIPKKYQFDIIGNFNRMLSYIHDKEKSLGKEVVESDIENEKKLAKEFEEKIAENFNEYYTKKHDIKKREKEIKKKRKNNVSMWKKLLKKHI